MLDIAVCALHPGFDHFGSRMHEGDDRRLNSKFMCIKAGVSIAIVIRDLHKKKGLCV